MMNDLIMFEGFNVLMLALLFVGWLASTLQGKLPDPRLLGANQFYPSSFVEAFEGDMDIVAGVMRMMLLTANHTEDPDDDFVNDVSADEASDASYGRVTLTNDAMTYDSVNDRAEYDFDDVVYPLLDNETITEAISYLQVGGDDLTEADDPLFCLWDIADTAGDGSNFTLQVGAEGAVQFS